MSTVHGINSRAPLTISDTNLAFQPQRSPQPNTRVRTRPISRPYCSICRSSKTIVTSVHCCVRNYAACLHCYRPITLRPSSIVTYLRKRNVVLIHCYNSANVIEPREPHTCNIAPSLRLLLRSSLQVWSPSADANRHHLHYSMTQDPVGMIRCFWRAFIR
jgi:hypothetical protein